MLIGRSFNIAGNFLEYLSIGNLLSAAKQKEFTEREV